MAIPTKDVLAQIDWKKEIITRDLSKMHLEQIGWKKEIDRRMDAIVTRDLSKMYLADPITLRDHRENYWAPTDAETWTLEAYVIQQFDMDQGDFELRFVYPERYPMGPVPLRDTGYEKGKFFLVVQAHDDDDVICDIEIEVKMWDSRYRLSKLWHGDEEPSFPADVLTTTDRHWVLVTEERPMRDDGKMPPRAFRSKPCSYKDAGGPALDPRQHDRMVMMGGPNMYVSHHTSFDRRMEWQPMQRARLNPNYHYGLNTPPARYTTDEYMQRQYVDRAHADEIMNMGEE